MKWENNAIPFQKQIVKKILQEHSIDALLISSDYNRFWYTTFSSTAGYLLILSNMKTYFFLDGRYITDGKNLSKNVDEFITFSNLKQIKKIVQEQNIKSLGFEKQYVTYEQYEIFSQNILENLSPINLNAVRIIKSPDEIEKIKKACTIGDQTFEVVLKQIKPGMTEREVDQIINNSFLKLGADKASFDSIVASGFRSAFPHGRATNKKIMNNEIITCDFGCIYEGYCSDMTRTFIVGDKLEEPKLLEIYNIVKEAQALGIKKIKPGVKCSDIDKVCRNYIEQKGYGKYFSHSTGHGLGIEVHEAPSVSFISETILETGMVITVEPGIYIPDLGGVRIEDDILVTDNGYEILTKSKKDLIYTNNN